MGVHVVWCFKVEVGYILRPAGCSAERVETVDHGAARYGFAATEQSQACQGKELGQAYQYRAGCAERFVDGEGKHLETVLRALDVQIETGFAGRVEHA